MEQIDAWRKAESETENLEFKEAKERFGFADILSCCVAIANERGGILLLGISNKPPRPVVGTKAYPSVERLKKDILERLHFRVDVEAVAHPDGRVLVFHVPSRPTAHPYHLDGAYLMRCGESLVPMTADQLQQIFDEEMSPVAKKVVYMVVAIGVFALFLLLYVGTEHLWRTESQSSDGRPAAEQGGSAKTPEHPHEEQSITTTQSRKPLLAGRVDWRDKQNWRKNLRVGMTKSEVRQLFGEAETVNVTSDMETWHYGSGDVTFFQGAVYSWYEPE